jgi:hypothetical protein
VTAAELYQAAAAYLTRNGWQTPEGDWKDPGWGDLQNPDWVDPDDEYEPAWEFGQAFEEQLYRDGAL